MPYLGPKPVNVRSASSLIVDGNLTAGETALENGLTVDKDGNTVATFDRATDDGTIIDIQRDGSTVGSVGTGYGVIDIKGGSAGLLMGNTAVLPVNGSGTLTTDSYDIGAGSFRFKDLYLSGGVYLGGTGAANQLDDYEEGTWTPSDGSGAGLSISISGTSTYEKVGNVVIATCRLTYPSTGSTAQAKVGGLPFTSKSTGANMQSAIISITSLGTAVTGLVLNNTDDVVFTNFSDGTQTNSNFSGKQIGLTAVYIAG